MTVVSGKLSTVTNAASRVTEVWVRAQDIRTHDGGLTTAENEPVDIATDGTISMTLQEGPAVLGLVYDDGDLPISLIYLLVNAEAQQDLADAWRLAQLTTGPDASMLGRLAQQVIDGMVVIETSLPDIRDARDQALEAIGEDRAGAVTAVTTTGTEQVQRVTTTGNTQVQRVGSVSQDTLDAAAAAKTSETNAGQSASAAATSASNAKTSETNAGQSATAAATSESDAGVHEENAEGAAAMSIVASELFEQFAVRGETAAREAEAAEKLAENYASTAVSNVRTELTDLIGTAVDAAEDATAAAGVAGVRRVDLANPSAAEIQATLDTLPVGSTVMNLATGEIWAH